MFRINELFRLDRKLFHTNDLAILWGIENRQTLYVTIGRYIKRGLLHMVYKGLYSTVPILKLDPLQLGRSIIHHYTYLSTESVLAQAGAIAQVVYDYTFVASRSKRMVIGSWSFRFRQLKGEYLYHPAGLHNKDGILTASPERAAADLLYFDPKYHFDLPQVLDLEKVKSIQKEIGYLC